MMKTPKLLLHMLIILSAMILATIGQAATQATTDQAQLLDRIVAVVNDHIITASTLNHQITLTQTAWRQAHKKPLPPPMLKKQLLQHLIDTTLQLQLADKLSIKVTAAEVTAAIAHIASQHKMTTAQLLQQIHRQGLTTAEYRHTIDQNITIARLQASVIGSRIHITPDQVATYLHTAHLNPTLISYHVRDLLIPLPESPTSDQITQAHRQALTLKQKLSAGADFEQLAIAYSGSNSILTHGDDLGWRHLASLPQLFAQPITHMHPGEVAGPIRTPNGFHLIKLVATKTDHTTISASTIRQWLYESRFNVALQSWIRRLRHQAYINIIP